MAKPLLNRAIGLMSGTSCDGIDAVLIETDGADQFQYVCGLTRPYARDVRRRLISAASEDVGIDAVLRLEREVTLEHVAAVNALRSKAPKAWPAIKVIGFHGHTLRHWPDERMTYQIGDPSLLAHEIAIPVVADFRRRDLAAGGEGAPLAPLFHQAMFAQQPKPTIVANLGGVANVTWLGSGGEVVAGDTGPGCGLLDGWVQTKANLECDTDGHLATEGKVQWPLVRAILGEPFFRRPLPKSADRYEFDIRRLDELNVADGAATLCALTVESMARACQQFPQPLGSMWVTGGGTRHPVLMEMLARQFGDVRNVSEAGLRADTLEAEGFAWLAVRRLRNLPLSQTSTTGCEQATCGGLLTT